MENVGLSFPLDSRSPKGQTACEVDSIDSTSLWPCAATGELYTFADVVDSTTSTFTLVSWSISSIKFGVLHADRLIFLHMSRPVTGIKTIRGAQDIVVGKDPLRIKLCCF